MKSTDVILGVEYCETAPLAYGQEPNVGRPNKVRFTEPLNSGWGWRKTHVAGTTEDTKFQGRITRWSRKGESVMAHASSLPYGTPARTSDLGIHPEGTEKDTFEVSKGHFKGERWNWTQECWMPALIKTASIHRTWLEYEANQQASKQRGFQREIDNAPNRYATGLREVVKNGLLAEKVLDEVVAELEAAWDKKVNEIGAQLAAHREDTA